MKTIVRNLTSEGWSDVELTLFLSGKRCIKGVAKEDGGQGSAPAACCACMYVCGHVSACVCVYVCVRELMGGATIPHHRLKSQRNGILSLGSVFGP